VPISTQQSVLLRMLARFDQMIAEWETQMPQSFDDADLRRAINQVADLHLLRDRVEAEINNSRDG
jgi:hypothetical protein